MTAIAGLSSIIISAISFLYMLRKICYSNSMIDLMTRNKHYEKIQIQHENLF